MRIAEGRIDTTRNGARAAKKGRRYVPTPHHDIRVRSLGLSSLLLSLLRIHGLLSESDDRLERSSDITSHVRLDSSHCSLSSVGEKTVEENSLNENSKRVDCTHFGSFSFPSVL